MQRTPRLYRKTAWSAAVIPFVLLLLGFALGWFVRPVQAAAPEAAPAYLDPVGLIEPAAMPEVTAEPRPVATPEPTPTYMGAFRATAYCPCERCCGKWAQYHLTASGTTPEEGRTVAADWSVLPAGTEVYIDGIGLRTVEDTGSGVAGQALDVYFENHEDALAWGVQEVEVFTYGP